MSRKRTKCLRMLFILLCIAYSITLLLKITSLNSIFLFNKQSGYCATIKMNSKWSPERIDYLTPAFKQNRIPYTLDLDDSVLSHCYKVELKRGKFGYSLLQRREVCLGDTEFKFVIDWLDAFYEVNQDLLTWSDKYFKSSWNSEVFKWSSKAEQAVQLGLFPSSLRDQFSQYLDEGKLLSIPWLSGWFDDGRAVEGIDKDANIVLGSLSHHVVTTTAEGRLRLYNLINDTFPGDPRVHLHILDQRDLVLKKNNDNQDSDGQVEWYEKYIFKSPFLEGENTSDRKIFQKFMEKVEFSLNLGGIAFSQPNRLEVACRHKAAVISDFIYAKYAQDFPAYFLSVDTQLNEMDEDKVKQELKYFMEHHKEIYEQLMPKQESWCRVRQWPRNWMHFMLRHVPDQPFSHLISDDTEAFDYYYGKLSSIDDFP